MFSLVVKPNIGFNSVGAWFKKTITYPYAFCVLLLLLIARLISMYVVPLNDSTEARYAEIARIMLETGNWITPMHYYGVPFWAKPPLSTWMSALSMQFFGVNAFAARLPGLLLSIGILWLVWDTAKISRGSRVAINTVLILSGSLYFMLNSGTVMTDPALLFCLTLSMVAFWRALTYNTKTWGILFFVGLGLGLLAKGPIAWVLIGLPISVWVVWQNAWQRLWKRLPWFSGILLMLAISLPWYILAEYKTPGFIQYFIVGEHIMRFLQPGWAGDKYGFAHIAPYGMIWLYALLGTLPWSAVGGVWLLGNSKKLIGLFKINIQDDGLLSYLLLCALLPLCFFTFARNIIYPYVFPSLPALAFLAANLIEPLNINTKKILGLTALTSLLFFLASIVFVMTPQYVAKSQNRVVQVFNNVEKSPLSQLIYWGYHTEYSALFYSSGHAVSTFNSDTLKDLLAKPGAPHYLIADSDVHIPIPDWVKPQLKFVAMIPILKRHITIYRFEPAE
jgi:4-amino-4-deoxy-L-arabinose transferase-like glycosyltransferase